MIRLLIVLLALAFPPANRAVEADPGTGDAAWAEILKAKKANVPAGELADQFKAFYKNFPTHPKASDAWIKEQGLRNQAAARPAVQPTAPQAVSNDVNTRIADAKMRIGKARAAGVEAGLGEMERSGYKLAADFPASPAGWQILMEAAQSFGGTKARQIYTDISARAPAPTIKAAAAARLKELNSPPRVIATSPKIELPRIKPINLTFNAVNGSPVDLAHMSGKVVLVQFWATWCPACKSEMPEIKRLYTEYHDQGLEVVGISLDEDADALNRYVASNQIPWPQHFDGRGWDNAFAKQFGITQIPTLYLIDKKGILRDQRASGMLSFEIQLLLKETD